MPLPDSRDLADLEALANVGEIVGPVTHEFNNLLNTLMLQIAVMEQSAPNGLRTELAGLKQHGRAAAALIRLVQQYRRQAPPEAPVGDLTEAVKAAVQSCPQTAGVHIGFTPGDGLPPVRAVFSDLKRLLTFLLGNAATAGGSHVAIRTEPSGRGTALVVEVTGPAVDPAFLSRLTAPTLSARDGAAGLELAAVRSMARRLGGELTADAFDGGTRVAVELPAG